MSDNQLDGKVAIITGGARGQGEAEARLFVSAGAKVVISDVLETEGQELANELGEQALFAPHDVASEEAWKEVVQRTLKEFGRIDVLVNNAAIHWTRPLSEERVEDFAAGLLSVNLLGPFLGIQAVTETMRNQGSGSIVNIASVAALGGLFGHGAYGSAKWGLRGLSKVAVVELGPLGIRINTIFPGPINTSMMSKGSEERFAQLPLGRAGEPDEIAPLVLFLASDASSYLTGAEIAVDGGMTTKTSGSPVPAQ